MVANISPGIRLNGVKAVAFDLDDTLFDRRAALTKLLENWLGAAEARRNEADFFDQDAHGQSPRREFFKWLATRHPTIGPDATALETRFRREFPACISPDPATLALLATLKDADIPLAVLSNGSSSFQMVKLRACGAAPFFPKNHLLFSSTLGFTKPDPRAFASLAERIGIAPDGILFVGDDPVRDISGAQAAGMKTCRLKRPHHPAVRCEADLALGSLAELAGILNQPRR